MKALNILAASMILFLAVPAAFAQQKMDDMKGMPMDKGMDMKSMPMDKGMDMKNTPTDKKDQPAAGTHHKANGTVKKLDEKAQVVTLAHGPVDTLNWPAMTMAFKVKNKALLPKLREGKKVQVDIVKEGDDYVVTSVK